MSNSSSLEKVQRCAHQIICGSSCSCDSLTPLSERRKTLALKCFLAMRDGDHILHHLFPQYLPSDRRLSLPYCRTSRRISSSVPSCIKFLYSNFQPLLILISSCAFSYRRTGADERCLFHKPRLNEFFAMMLLPFVSPGQFWGTIPLSNA